VRRVKIDKLIKVRDTDRLSLKASSRYEETYIHYRYQWGFSILIFVAQIRYVGEHTILSIRIGPLTAICFICALFRAICNIELGVLGAVAYFYVQYKWLYENIQY